MNLVVIRRNHYFSTVSKVLNAREKKKKKDGKAIKLNVAHASSFNSCATYMELEILILAHFRKDKSKAL